MYKTKYHRDGTVTLWNVFRQTWERMPAEDVSDQTLATLHTDEREKICKMAAQDAESERCNDMAIAQYAEDMNLMEEEGTA